MSSGASTNKVESAPSPCSFLMSTPVLAVTPAMEYATMRVIRRSKYVSESATTLSWSSTSSVKMPPPGPSAIFRFFWVACNCHCRDRILGRLKTHNMRLFISRLTRDTTESEGWISVGKRILYLCQNSVFTSRNSASASMESRSVVLTLERSCSAVLKRKETAVQQRRSRAPWFIRFSPRVSLSKNTSILDSSPNRNLNSSRFSILVFKRASTTGRSSEKFLAARASIVSVKVAPSLGTSLALDMGPSLSCLDQSFKHPRQASKQAKQQEKREGDIKNDNSQHMGWGVPHPHSDDTSASLTVCTFMTSDMLPIRLPSFIEMPPLISLFFQRIRLSSFERAGQYRPTKTRRLHRWTVLALRWSCMALLASSYWATKAWSKTWLSVGQPRCRGAR